MTSGTSAPGHDQPTPHGVDGVPPAEVLAAVQRLADAAEAQDGHPPFNEQTMVRLRTATDPSSVHTVSVEGPDDQLLGAAVIVTDPGEDALVELAVHPQARRRGIGAALAREVASRLDGAAVQAWSHGDSPGAAAMAQDEGLQPVRELYSMALDVATAAIPEPRLPEGVRLRSFVPGQDEQAWLGVNAAAFADHPEQGRMSLADLAERERSSWFDAAGFLLAVDEQDEVLGFHWTKIEPTQDGPAEGEVYAVGVSPAAQGSGLGRALTVAGLQYLVGVGMQRIMLYVDADNTPAVRLYTSLGFTRADVDVMYRRGAALRD